MKRYIPTFMRNPTYFALGTAAVGTLVYTLYSQRLDKKLSHPLVKESILLLQNNDEVVQLIGVPIMLEQTIGSRASLSDDAGHFSYKVRGPRGKLAVEMAGQSLPHSQLGPNQKGKIQMKATNPTAHVPDNLDEHNYNEFYVPDSQLINDYFSLSIKKNSDDEAKSVQPNDRFWKYEYLFTEVDRDVRILIAPDEKLAAQQQSIVQRNNMADLKNEFSERLKTYRTMNSNMSSEEKEEFRKIRLTDHYRKIGYVRNYMMLAMGFIAMNVYVIFRKNKRLPIMGSSLQTNIERALMKSNEFRAAIPGYQKVHFVQTSIGARVGDNADYSFYFMAPEAAGKVFVNCDFNPESGLWKVNNLEFEVNKGETNVKSDRVKVDKVPEL